MHGPGFSTLDLIGIAAFAANYAIVAPVSAVCVVVAIALRGKRSPRWLAPVAVLNLLVVVPQLLMASDVEWWLTVLLVLQAAAAVAVVVWVARDASSRRARRGSAPSSTPAPS